MAKNTPGASYRLGVPSSDQVTRVRRWKAAFRKELPKQAAAISAADPHFVWIRDERFLALARPFHCEVCGSKISQPPGVGCEEWLATRRCASCTAAEVLDEWLDLAKHCRMCGVRVTFREYCAMLPDRRHETLVRPWRARREPHPECQREMRRLRPIAIADAKLCCEIDKRARQSAEEVVTQQLGYGPDGGQKGAKTR